MAGTLPRPGVVVVSDIDLDLPDARRTHTLEVTRWLARLGFAPDLVSRGADPGARRRALPRGPARRGHARAAGARQPARHRRAAAPAADARARCTCGTTGRWRRRPSRPGCWATASWRRSTTCRTAAAPRPRAPGPLKRRLADGVKRRFAAALFRATDEVVAVTEQVAAIVRRDYRIAAARVHVIGNGVDVDLFVPRDRAAAARAAGLDPEARHLAFVGLFAPWVDFACMLEAFARVGASRPDVRLRARRRRRRARARSRSTPPAWASTAAWC